MGQEIERKYLVTGDGWRASANDSTRIRQGYIFADDRGNLRVRISDGKDAVITIKSGGGFSRAEFEYTVPLDDGRELMGLAGGRIVEKTRYALKIGGKGWVVDVFEGRHNGLVLAEIELGSEDEPFERPDWAGEDVTENPAYSNASLAGAN
jgi:adenylate cyclase